MWLNGRLERHLVREEAGSGITRAVADITAQAFVVTRVILCLLDMQYSSLQWSTQSAFISFLGNGITVFPHFYFFLEFSVLFSLYTFGNEWNKVTNCFFERLWGNQRWHGLQFQGSGGWSWRTLSLRSSGYTVRRPVSKIRDLDLPGLVHQLVPGVFLSPLPSSGVIGVHCDVWLLFTWILGH